MLNKDSIRPFSDTAAIGLSIACTAHCLFLPLMVTTLPSAMALSLEGEAFHRWLLFLVVPISAFALTLGCRKHHNKYVAATGFAGLLILLLAGTVVEHSMNELAEKTGTVIGAGFIALSHYWNYRLCQHQHSDTCGCAAHK